MDRYERTIGVKTFWATIIRRWHVFFMIFIPIALISYIVTDKMLTKTYISNISISKAAVITASEYAVIQSYVKNTSSEEGKEGALYLTAKNLKEEQFFHSNGTEITIREINSGLSFASLANNSLVFSFSFQSSDSAITQKVLNELAKNTVETLKTRVGANYVTGNASSAVKNSKERTYFLIALAAGFVVAFGIPFVDEIVSDEVYDKYDIESLGCSAFEVKAKPKKKEA